MGEGTWVWDNLKLQTTVVLVCSKWWSLADSCIKRKEALFYQIWSKNVSDRCVSDPSSWFGSQLSEHL